MCAFHVTAQYQIIQFILGGAAMNIKNKMRVSVSLLVISSFILSGCESVSSKDMLVGAAAIGAAGALGYYAGHHKRAVIMMRRILILSH